MPTKIKDLGPCEKEIEVSIPEASIRSALAKSFGELRKQIVLPGFRPGKVPLGVLDKRFGTQVRHEVYHDLVDDAVSEAISEHKLEPVSDPRIGDDEGHEGHALPAAGDLEIRFTVEVKPEFDPPKYRGLEVTRRIAPVTDEEIDRVLSRFTDSRAEWLPVENEEYSDGDLVQVTANLSVEGETLLEDEAETFLLITPDVGDVRLDDAERIVKEHGVDAVVPVTGTVTAWHPRTELRGKPATGTVIIEGFKRRTAPPLDDDLAKVVGKNSVAELREDVRKDLEVAHRKSADRKIVREILDRLIDATDCPLAQGPIERMLKHRLERQTLDLEEEGVSHEEAEIQAKAKEDEFRRAIERNSRGWFLVEKIAKKEKIFCLEDDVDQVIQGLAREHGAQPSAVRKYYEEKHMLGELRMEIIERKVCEFLLDQAKITDEEGDPASSAIAEDAGEES